MWVLTKCEIRKILEFKLQIKLYILLDIKININNISFIVFGVCFFPGV